MNRNEKKMICFDMDGTIADFYGVEGWLDMPHNEDPTPYLIAKPLCDMNALRGVLLRLAEEGWEIRVISWLAGNSSESYKELTRQAKMAWLKRYNFPFDAVHLVQYGTTKADCVRRLTSCAILIDDNKKIRDGWHLGETIDPTNCNLIEVLKELLGRD